MLIEISSIHIFKFLIFRITDEIRHFEIHNFVISDYEKIFHSFVLQSLFLTYHGRLLDCFSIYTRETLEFQNFCENPDMKLVGKF